MEENSFPKPIIFKFSTRTPASNHLQVRKFCYILLFTYFLLLRTFSFFNFLKLIGASGYAKGMVSLSSELIQASMRSSNTL